MMLTQQNIPEDQKRVCVRFFCTHSESNTCPTSGGPPGTLTLHRKLHILCFGHLAHDASVSLVGDTSPSSMCVERRVSQPVAIQTANLCFCLTNPCGPHAYLCTSLFKDPVGDMSARSSDSALDPGRLQGRMPSRATPLAFKSTARWQTPLASLYAVSWTGQPSSQCRVQEESSLVREEKRSAEGLTALGCAAEEGRPGLRQASGDRQARGDREVCSGGLQSHQGSPYLLRQCSSRLQLAGCAPATCVLALRLQMPQETN